MNELNEDVKNLLNEGRQLLDEVEIQEKIDEMKTEAELLIRKHPIKSVLIGAAAGFLFARFLRGD